MENVEQGLRARFPPDREILYGRRYPVGARLSASWRRSSTDSSHFVNFRRGFFTRGDRPAAAYAHLTVHARKPLQTCLLVKAHCGLEVRLGGKSIYRQQAREKAPYFELVPAFFRAGDNSLLVKGVYEKGEWGFSLMVVDSSSDLTFITPEGPSRPSQSY